MTPKMARDMHVAPVASTYASLITSTRLTIVSKWAGGETRNVTNNSFGLGLACAGRRSEGHDDKEEWVSVQ